MHPILNSSLGKCFIRVMNQFIIEIDVCCTYSSFPVSLFIWFLMQVSLVARHVRNCLSISDEGDTPKFSVFI